MLTPKFLVVDDVPENRFLLAKTLLRKFPEALVQECQLSTPAILAAKSELTAIIVHRSEDLDGPALIAALRKVNPKAALVMVSGRDSCPEAFTAGADAFLNYDAWLRIGTVVEDLLRARAHSAPPGGNASGGSSSPVRP